MRRFLLAVGLLLSAAMACADQRIFYQPLNADASLSQAQWQRIWQDTAKQGTHTVIVQWTAYGDSDFGGAQGLSLIHI